jgi:glycosyltransferase involved in cell wall biosynthesis
MKLTVLVESLHQAGGLERSLSQKVDYWLGSAPEIIIVTHNNDAPDFYAFNGKVERASLNVRYDRHRSLYSARNAICAVRHFIALRSFLRRARPDVVIHCGYGYDFYFLPILASKRALLVKENHSSRFNHFVAAISWRRKVSASFRTWFESRYDVVVFLSKEEAELSGQKNAIVIPNGLRAATPRPAPRKRQVIAAGRICHVKGFDRLVRAWALAAARLPNWRLAIYGDGEPQDVVALERLVEELSLGDSVDIFPARADVIDCMAESSIYAMASRSECFPMVLLEASQLGVPVIAFDCPTGPRNIIKHGQTGLLIPDGDLTAFADALVRLTKDSKALDQMSDAARKESAMYDMDAVAVKWAEVFARHVP